MPIIWIISSRHVHASGLAEYFYFFFFHIWRMDGMRMFMYLSITLFSDRNYLAWWEMCFGFILFYYFFFSFLYCMDLVKDYVNGLSWYRHWTVTACRIFIIFFSLLFIIVSIVRLKVFFLGKFNQKSDLKYDSIRPFSVLFENQTNISMNDSGYGEKKISKSIGRDLNSFV